MDAQEEAEEGDSIRVVDMDNGTFASGGPNTGKHSVDCCLSEEYDVRQRYLNPTRGPKFLAFGKTKSVYLGYVRLSRAVTVLGSAREFEDSVE